MALINCEECGKQISDKAAACPNCGNPINQSPDEKEFICCPKCQSAELHSEQKGFSGKKALIGGIIGGGLGILAGTIGSKDVQLTCLKCGNKFKAGEALIINKDGNSIDNELKTIIETKGVLYAINYYQKNTKCDLSTSKKYIDNLVANNKIITKTGGGCMSVIVILVIIITFFVFYAA